MRLKGAGPYFQCSMQNKVLNGPVYEICEIFIDDVLIHGKSEAEFLRNVRRVFERLCAKNVAVGYLPIWRVPNWRRNLTPVV